MPLKEYPIQERIFGNLVVSAIFTLFSLFMLVVLNISFKISITPTSYFIFPSYFGLITLFSELKVRKEKKNDMEKTV